MAALKVLCVILTQWWILSALLVVPNSTAVSGTGYRTRDRQYRKIVVTTILEEPYMMLKERSPFLAGNDRFEGYLADMLGRLALAIGFQYEIRLVKDGKYGRPGENGTWSGMVGEVLRGEADIAAGPLTITPDVQKVVDFTVSFLKFRSTAILKKPRRRKDRIHSVSELKYQREIQYGLIQGSLTEKVFRFSKKPEYRQMWTRMVNAWPSTFVHSVQEGIEKAKREKYAFILDAPKAEYIVSRKPCDMYALEPFLDIRYYAFVMKKGDRLKSVIDKEFMRMRHGEEGQRLYLKWWTGACRGRHKKGRHKHKQTTLGQGGTTMRPPWRSATRYPPNIVPNHSPSHSSVSSLFALILTRTMLLYFR